MQNVELEKLAYIDSPGTPVDESLKPEVIKQADSSSHCKQDDNSQ